MRKILVVLIGSVLAAPGISRADATTGAAFLKIDPSVRNQALGGAQPAYSFGSQAVGSNPANVSLLKGSGEAFASFSSLMDNSNYGSTALAIKAGSRAYAVSATQWSSGTMDRRDDTGAVTGKMSARDLALGFTVSQKLGHWRVGATGKGVQSSLAGYSSGWTPAADAGVSYLYKKSYWGLGISNAGAGLKYRGISEPLPTSVNGGVALAMGPATVIAGVTRWMKEKQTNSSLGMEYEISALTLRLGYRGATGTNLALKTHDTTYQLASDLAAGVGIAIRSLRIDYAVSMGAAEFGISHRVGVTWAWGMPAKKAASPSVNRGTPVRRSTNKPGKVWVR